MQKQGAEGYAGSSTAKRMRANESESYLIEGWTKELGHV